MIGLQVPGLLTKQRDQALKASALRLLDEGYRRLLRDAGVREVRPGFEQLRPALLKAMRDYFAWYQELAARADGTLDAETVERELYDFRLRYAPLRKQTLAILAATGRATTSKPGKTLAPGRAPGQSWESWLKSVVNVPHGIGLGLMIGIGVLVYLMTQKQTAQPIYIVQGIQP